MVHAAADASAAAAIHFVFEHAAAPEAAVALLAVSARLADAAHDARALAAARDRVQFLVRYLALGVLLRL